MLDAQKKLKKITNERKLPKFVGHCLDSAGEGDKLKSDAIEQAGIKDKGENFLTHQVGI